MRNSFIKSIAFGWENAERILTVVFLATFTLNIRKVFLTPYSFLKDNFNEYMAISFSWADLLMLIVIIIYTIKWLHKQVVLRRVDEKLPYHNKGYMSTLLRPFASVSRETVTLLFFLLWILASVSWAGYKPIAIYRFLTLIEIIAFFLILLTNFSHAKWLRMAIFALIVNGLFQASLGIIQFINGGSIGWHFLGESIVSQNLPGVAKIILGGEKHIRAYGTFPHPNIMAGFLIIPLIFLFSELFSRIAKRFKSSSEVSRETFLPKLSERFLIIALVTVFCGFFLTFSRSGYLGLIMAILLILLINLRYKITHFKPYFIKLTILIFILVISSIFILLTLSRNNIIFSQQSLAERNFLLNVSRGIISKNFFNGVGIGQFVFNELIKYPHLEGWQYQPVHNIYLLIFSELGFMGFFFFFLFILFSIFKEKKKEFSILTMYSIYVIVFTYFFIAFFDHYFWDIKTGTIIFALSMILSKLFQKKTIFMSGN